MIQSLLPLLHTLHQRCNLSEHLVQSWVEAAYVSLSPYPSPALFHIGGDSDCARMLAHAHPRAVEFGSNANTPEATTLGAYAVALSVVEDRYSLFAVRRARHLSGSDIIVSTNRDDWLLENALRLEVSGTLGSAGTVRARFKMKCNQVLQGKSELSAIVCIVGFAAGIVLIERITT